MHISNTTCSVFFCSRYYYNYGCSEFFWDKIFNDLHSCIQSVHTKLKESNKTLALIIAELNQPESIHKDGFSLPLGITLTSRNHHGATHRTSIPASGIIPANLTMAPASGIISANLTMEPASGTAPVGKFSGTVESDEIPHISESVTVTDTPPSLLGDEK